MNPTSPFPGLNTLTLNEATLKQMVQHYFDQVLFAQGMSPKVIQVYCRTEGGGRTFEVEIEEPAT